MSLNCLIPDRIKFDRKHYFYPDLPKSFQISQLDEPVGECGYLEIELENTPVETKRVGITRIHIEEDAGKLSHSDQSGDSLVDYNRSGIPLLEIVSEPDIRTAYEARAYLTELRLVLLYLGISDCDMENGSLRCDLNISVRPVGASKLGTRIEVKNMNSFRSVGAALDYERDRQIHTLQSNGRLIQCTRLWDEDRSETRMMRSKEDEDDYRYFPEPDIPPIYLDKNRLTTIMEHLPESPQERFTRYQSLGILRENALTMVHNKDWGDCYDRACEFTEKISYVDLSNWIISELGGWLKDHPGLSMSNLLISPKNLGDLMKSIESQEISGKQAKQVLAYLLENGGEVSASIELLGLKQISDDASLEKLIRKVIGKNPSVVEDLKQGKKKAFGYLMGQIMKLSQGQANPSKVNKMLREVLVKDFEIEA
tara:strand:- start:567 stop:1841 length:1275 start_codon:yes stop_codon:yes gene_type:complete